MLTCINLMVGGVGGRDFLIDPSLVQFDFIFAN